MKKYIHYFIWASFVLTFLSSCQKSINIDDQVSNQPDARNVAFVTFLRPYQYGSAVNYELWDSHSFLGEITGFSYCHLKISPGKHNFLLREENWKYLGPSKDEYWSCIEADLEPGKRYIIIMRSIMGMRGIVSLDPVTPVDGIPKETITRWIENLDEIIFSSSKNQIYSKSNSDHLEQAIKNAHLGKIVCRKMKRADWFEAL